MSGGPAVSGGRDGGGDLPGAPEHPTPWPSRARVPVQGLPMSPSSPPPRRFPTCISRSCPSPAFPSGSRTSPGGGRSPGQRACLEGGAAAGGGVSAFPGWQQRRPRCQGGRDVNNAKIPPVKRAPRGDPAPPVCRRRGNEASGASRRGRARLRREGGIPGPAQRPTGGIGARQLQYSGLPTPRIPREASLIRGLPG